MIQCNCAPSSRDDPDRPGCLPRVHVFPVTLWRGGAMARPMDLDNHPPASSETA